jgi:hypothetical protein
MGKKKKKKIKKIKKEEGRCFKKHIPSFEMLTLHKMTRSYGKECALKLHFKKTLLPDLY